jgi:pyruvate/2-oxoglutarate dehydrogenase complex dihydrolipoamide acyltransferase (E2) component
VVAKFASPQAKRLADQLGLDPALIHGTGKGGAITADDVRSVAPPEPPADLEAAGRELWRSITATYELRADELRLLTEACRTTDELERLRVALAEAEPVVAGSKGQVRPHPLIAEIRAHRLALRGLLASIGIEDADAQDGDAAAQRSQAGRALARQRWGGRRR